MPKRNCWEIKKCGRELGGHNVREYGVCPAASETRLDGVHGGINGGRACWILAGTFCGGKVQGTFASKLNSCLSCEFIKTVMQEEDGSFEDTARLLSRFKGD